MQQDSKKISLIYFRNRTVKRERTVAYKYLNLKSIKTKQLELSS